jgi:hypothetical protein
MAKVDKYADIIEREMSERAGKEAANMPMVERMLLTDAKRRQFALFSVGWKDSAYIHQCLIHIQIKGEEIWIHEDLTDPGIYESLVEQGVPHAKIVLGFVSEAERSGRQLPKTA